MGEIDEENPCPQCGESTASLTERTEKDFKPVIPKDLQYDFKGGVEIRENKFIPKTAQERYETRKSETAQKRVSQNIPLDSILPTIENAVLDPASLKVYFQLSIEYQIILDKASNYQEGAYSWNMILPDRLQSYGLTEDTWDKISSIGDNDQAIQKHLSQLLKKIF